MVWRKGGLRPVKGDFRVKHPFKRPRSPKDKDRFGIYLCHAFSSCHDRLTPSVPCHDIGLLHLAQRRAAHFSQVDLFSLLPWLELFPYSKGWADRSRRLEDEERGTSVLNSLPIFVCPTPQCSKSCICMSSSFSYTDPVVAVKRSSLRATQSLSSTSKTNTEAKVSSQRDNFPTME